MTPKDVSASPQGIRLGFLVNLPTFSGSLSELIHALRSLELAPQEIDLYQLVRNYLHYYQQVAQESLDLATEALPYLARVIELKTRLLLPRPPQESEDEEDPLEETLEAVALLEEFEDAIQFLRQRRNQRRVLLAAAAPRPQYPRPERPIKVSISRLAELASRHRLSSYFELAVERLSMATAIKHLQARLKLLRRAVLTDLVASRDWATLAVSFAGFLELFKENKVRAKQDSAYGPIELELTAEQRRDAA